MNNIRLTQNVDVSKRADPTFLDKGTVKKAGKRTDAVACPVRLLETFFNWMLNSAVCGGHLSLEIRDSKIVCRAN